MRIRYFLIVLFIHSSFQLFSQIENITIRKISPPGGFSFQAIHTIKQDAFGYIWMGTFDGVIRYDSKETIRFVNDYEKTDGLPSNKTTGIAIDNKNNIWVSTNKGLCLFNHTKQQFERINYNYENGDIADSNIKCITIDSNGKLWIADSKFFGYLDRENKQLIRLKTGIKDIPSIIYNDEVGRLWLGTTNGSVYSVLPNKNKIVKKIDGPGSNCSTIFADYDEIWVGYLNHGVLLYNLDGKLKSKYVESLDNKYKLESGNVRKIWKDTHQRIWIASYQGLFLAYGEQLIRFEPNEYPGLPHNSIYEIFEDSQGGIWLGTWSGGVAYIHHSDNKFNNFQHSNAPNSLSNNVVSSFAQMGNKDIFVGTEVGGLNKFNPTSQTFQHIQISGIRNIINIKSLCIDKYNGLWVGTAFSGLWHKEFGSSKFRQYSYGPADGQHISGNGVFALCPSDSGVWIGANPADLYPGGLNFYRFKTKKIAFTYKTNPFSEFKNQAIRCITVDSKDNLWAGTLDGLFKLHLPTEQLLSFLSDSISRNKINSSVIYIVKEMDNENIWIGTKGDGINIYNPETGKITAFDSNGLLSKKDVYGILEDAENNIWITTNDGLLLFDKRNKKLRKFTINDGIQSNLFIPQSVFKDKSENLYFGGTNGFTQLASSEVHLNNRPPNSFINQIELKNRKLIPQQLGINSFAEIELEPNETTLKFFFAADNYLLSEKNKFKYRLTNYSEGWLSTNNDASATFINVPAGEYFFEVKAANNDGIWNENPARIPIKIKQFWYKSQLALLFYFITFLAITLLIFRFYLERIKLRKSIIIGKIERERDEELHEMKLKFFTNISHEFRTPLTLINWPLKKLSEAENLTSEQLEQLSIVSRNANRLLQLINQIMDLRKVERGQSKLNITKIELIGFITERFLNFKEEAKSKHIEFTFEKLSNELFIEADEEKLDKIIYNLLSNAFKYTNEHRSIRVSVRTNELDNNDIFSNKLSFGKIDTEDFVDISVIDTGQGIDSQDLSNVFDRFEQGGKDKGKINSSGIGLNLCKEFTLLHRGAIVVQSTPDKGTSFSVQLPTKQKAQKIFYDGHEKVKNIKSWESIEKEQTNMLDGDKSDTLLIVEDNEDLRKFLVTFLQNYFKILSAENGETGLSMLRSKNVDLVVSDIMMPVMDGLEFCQKIKSQIETSHIPVILLTALSSPENKIIGYDKGADAYISKPFDEDVLLSQIRNLLLQRKRLQENYSNNYISTQTIDVSNLDNYFLNKLNSIIEKNIENENFSVEILADEMGFHRSQLHRKLKQISNHSTSEYITMVRIKKATELLASGKYNIEKAAFKTGFSSHSYFSLCFKKIHKQSPKEFLRSVTN